MSFPDPSSSSLPNLFRLFGLVQMDFGQMPCQKTCRGKEKRNEKDCQYNNSSTVHCGLPAGGSGLGGAGGMVAWTA